MKMTMHIDEDVLDEVMKLTGAPSKTKAVETALRETLRRTKFQVLAKEGLGVSSEELKTIWEDPFPEEPSLRVAEEPPKHARKHSGG